MPRITMQVALGLGTSGAMVDVTAYVSNTIGVSHTYGKQDEFRDIAPGTIGFTLFNTDGRFTPGNPNQPYATAITEGTPVSWLAGGRLRSGSILSFGFPQDETVWSEMTILCDDMLGNAGRSNIAGTSIAEALVASNTPYLYWPMTDAVGSAVAAETSGNAQPPLAVRLAQFGGSSATFGTAPIPGIGRSQVQVSATNTNLAFRSTGAVGNGVVGPGQSATNSTIPYPPNSAGAWGFWFTPLSDPCDFTLSGGCFVAAPLFQLKISSLAAGFSLRLSSGTTVTTGPLTVGVPHYISFTTAWVNGVSLSATLFLDGIAQGTSVWAPTGLTGDTTTLFALTNISIDMGSNSATESMNISGISHTPNGINEALIPTASTEAGWLAILGQLSSGVSIGTIPADLSLSPIGPVALTNSTQLALISDVIRTEQGSIYSATTGTLLAPVQALVVRARNRTTTPAITLDASTDIQGVVPFVRDKTNLVSSVTATGIGTSAIAVNSAAVARASSSNASETVLFNQYADALAWGQDRISRGANVNVRVVAITVDALVTSTDRNAALLALVLGDRVRVNNIPSTMLGITQWDGWLLGASETHSLLRHEFVLYLQPVLPDVAIFDTNMWSGGTNFTLSSGMAATGTSMQVSSSDSLTAFETVVFPYNVIVEFEVMTVTAATALSAGTQTLTVVRGAAGTTPAVHGAVPVDITPPSLYAF